MSLQAACEDAKLKDVFGVVVAVNAACFLSLTYLHFRHTNIDTGRPAGAGKDALETKKRLEEEDDEYERMVG